MLVSTNIQTGSYNTIKKKKSEFWMIIPQIDPNVMRDFFYSQAVVLIHCITCLKRSPLPINEMMHMEKLSKLQRAATGRMLI